jgi:hypothetical protein
MTTGCGFRDSPLGHGYSIVNKVEYSETVLQGCKLLSEYSETILQRRKLLSAGTDCKPAPAKKPHYSEE